MHVRAPAAVAQRPTISYISLGAATGPSVTLTSASLADTLSVRSHRSASLPSSFAALYVKSCEID